MPDAETTKEFLAWGAAAVGGPTGLWAFMRWVWPRMSGGIHTYLLRRWEAVGFREAQLDRKHVRPFVVEAHQGNGLVFIRVFIANAQPAAVTCEIGGAVELHDSGSRQIAVGALRIKVAHCQAWTAAEDVQVEVLFTPDYAAAIVGAFAAGPCQLSGVLDFTARIPPGSPVATQFKWAESIWPDDPT